jgi:excisionase family DNA binding protein
MTSRTRPRINDDRPRPRINRDPEGRAPRESGHRHRGDDRLKFFKIAEVAELLSVSTRTVRRWIDDGLLIAHRIRGVVLIAENDLRTSWPSIVTADFFGPLEALIVTHCQCIMTFREYSQCVPIRYAMLVFPNGQLSRPVSPRGRPGQTRKSRKE